MKYFEDYAIGESFEHGAYVVSAEEIMAFARQYDPQPFHLDPAAAAASVFGGLTASGFHTVAIQGALMHSCPEAAAAVIAGLGWDEVRFRNPVRVGDTPRRLTEHEREPVDHRLGLSDMVLRTRRERGGRRD